MAVEVAGKYLAGCAVGAASYVVDEIGVRSAGNEDDRASILCTGEQYGREHGGDESDIAVRLRDLQYTMEDPYLLTGFMSGYTGLYEAIRYGAEIEESVGRPYTDQR